MIKISFKSIPDIEIIESLYETKEDLILSWPKAKYPFCQDQWKSWFNDQTKSKKESVVLFDGNEVIGHMAYLKYHDAPSLNYLCFLVIKKSHQGKGMAKKFLKLFENELSARKEKSIYLIAHKDNPRAVSLYRNQSYKVIEEKAYYRMKKQLN